MRYIGVFVVIAVLAYAFLGDSGSSAKPDLREALKRAEAALVKFDKYLKENSIEKAEEKHMTQLASDMQTEMNKDPRFYKESLIAMKLLKDAKFEGFKDDNKNGVADSGEKKLFSIEVDAGNKRLIGTGPSGSSYGHGLSGLATGFLAGALISNLMGRQSSAGITQNSFNQRRVAPASSFRQSSPRARSSSGSRFGGK
ncbi:MAG: hypothetical protein ACRBBN_09360 [Methyloligellaceae bacterium]